MRIRLDSSLADDGSWTTPPTRAARTLVGGWQGAQLCEADGTIAQAWSDPLAALAWLDTHRRDGGRWVGFLSYELGRLLEPAVVGAAGTSREAGDVPLFAWGLVPPGRGGAGQTVTGWPGGAGARGERAHGGDVRSGDVRSSFTRVQYLAAARRCLDYIGAGDVFQVNIAQRLEVGFGGSAGRLYGALLEQAPAAYGALLEFADFAVISNSPELFLRVTTDRRVITRPIKGTRPNGAGLGHMAEELRASAKDAAELNMIVDLERNDLGRVCETGSVQVTQPRTIEAHPTVFHGVAQVEGRLREEVGLVELLGATFPGGSVTGAPKIRAMQIIDELEPVGRGVYCGAIGYLDEDGSQQLSLAIRMMRLEKRTGTLHIPVGGGIVAESDPEAEYEETWVKARAALKALELVTCPPCRRSATSSPGSRVAASG